MRSLKSTLIRVYKGFTYIFLLLGCSPELHEMSVIPRNEWCAYPPVFTHKLDEFYIMNSPYEGIIIHYSGFSNTLSPKDIQVYHLTKLGYADINYHFLIDRHGFIYEGRDMIYKAEAYPEYEKYIHICCISDRKFYKKGWLTKKQRSSLKEAIVYLSIRYDIENKYIKYFESTGYEYVNFPM